MKRRFTNALLLAVAVVMASCGDDDEGPSNYYVKDGSKKGLSSSAVWLYDENAGTSSAGADIYFHDITLFSSGISINGTSATGKGDVITLMLSSGSTEIETGTHEFVGNDTDAEPNDFVAGYMDLDFDVSTQQGDEYEFESGKVTVAKSGDVYTVDFEGQATSSDLSKKVQVSGHYSGTFTKIPKD